MFLYELCSFPEHVFYFTPLGDYIVLLNLFLLLSSNSYIFYFKFIENKKVNKLTKILMRRLSKEIALFVSCIKQCFWYYSRESDLNMIHGRKIHWRKVYGRKKMIKDMISLVQGIFVIVKKSSNLNLFGTSVGFLCFVFCFVVVAVVFVCFWVSFTNIDDLKNSMGRESLFIEREQT